MTPHPTVLTVIVSYNFCKWIDKCLNSLQNSDFQTDVMVVDNHSSDATVQTIRQRYPWVKLLPQDSNLGFGRANNIGMQYAIDHHYDYVFLLNEDAWIDKETLGTLVEASASNPDYGIVSPVHLTGSGKNIEKGFSDYTSIHSIDELQGISTQLVEAPFINAAIWLMPVEIIKRVGMFAPLFYHYGEDKDLVNRMHYYGYKVGFSPRVMGYHDREFRKSTRSSRLRGERVYHLSEYANVNYPASKAFAMGVLAPVKKSLSALFHGHLRDTAAYLSMSLNLLHNTPAVLKTRKQSAKS